MEILFRIAADLTVTLHLGYALFILLGQAAVMIGAVRGWKWVRNTRFRLIHLAAILIVVGESWLGITCPLTTLEKFLRSRSGSASYEGDFIANFVHDVLFLECKPWVFTAMYSLFGLAVLITLAVCPPAMFARKSLAAHAPGEAVPSFRNTSTRFQSAYTRWKTLPNRAGSGSSCSLNCRPEVVYSVMSIVAPPWSELS